MDKQDRIAMISVFAYVAVVLGCLLPSLLPPHGELDGVLAIVATLPWSLVGVLVVDGIAPSLLDTGYGGALIVLISGAINVYLIFRMVGRRGR